MHYSMQRSCSSQQFTSKQQQSTSSSSAAMTTSSSNHFGVGQSAGDKPPGGLQRSSSTSNCVIVNKRGFKPSDRFDPAKKEFLLGLSKQIWQRDVPNVGKQKPIDLQKLFTPADDAVEILPQKNRKLYASSAFFAPGFHPTVEDQVELARMISSSLYDASNQQSKGQSMYVNRKKRSVKWVHEGEGDPPSSAFDDVDIDFEVVKDVGFESTTANAGTVSKLPLKLVMDPRGKTQSFQSAESSADAFDEAMTISSSKVCEGLMNTAQTTSDKGAELFAKRRKCSENNSEQPKTLKEPKASASGEAETTVLAKRSEESELKTMELNAIHSSKQSVVKETSIQEIGQYHHHHHHQQQQRAAQTHVAKFTTNVPRELAYKTRNPMGWSSVCPNLPKTSYSAVSFAAPEAVLVTSTTNDYPTTEPAELAETKLHTTATDSVVATDTAEIVQALKTISKSMTSEHETHAQHTFVKCLAKSPELIKSDARSNFVKVNIDRCEQSPPSPTQVPASLAPIESQFDTKTKVKPKPTVQPVCSIAQRVRCTPSPLNNDHHNLESADDDPESYRTIPVRDLISTFEKQSQPVLRYKVREDKFPVATEQHASIQPNAADCKIKATSPKLPPPQPQQPIIVSAPAVAEECETIEPIKPEPEPMLETIDLAEDDAFSDELKMFNEIAADFSASIALPAAESSEAAERSKPTDLTYHNPPQILSPIGNGRKLPPIQERAGGPSPNNRIRSPFMRPSDNTLNPSPQPAFNGQNDFSAASPTTTTAYYPPPQPHWQPKKYPIISDPAAARSYSAEPPAGGSVGRRTPTPTHRSPLNLDELQNYNRAARGWGQSKDFYRPITFNKPKMPSVYTDF